MRYALFSIAFSVTLSAHESPSDFFTAKLHTCQSAITKILASTQLAYARLPHISTVSFFPPSYPYLIGSCGIAGICFAFWSFIHTQYPNHPSPQLTLGAWVAEMEQQSAKANDLISPELQRNVSQFLAVDMHNYVTLKKAIAADALQGTLDSIKNNNLYTLLPLFESDSLTQKAQDDRVYSVLIEPSEDTVGAQRREFFIKKGRCIGTHIYTFRQTPDNAFGIPGIYQTTCYYPKNESDLNSECAQYLMKVNALIETKKKYDLFHAEWQAQKQHPVTAQTPPWDAKLYTIVLAELEKYRCKGDLKKKQYCIRTMRCEARDIVATFKEYEYWINRQNKEVIHAAYSPDIIVKARDQARELFSSKTIHTPFNFEQLNQIKKSILQKAHA